MHAFNVVAALTSILETLGLSLCTQAIFGTRILYRMQWLCCRWFEVQSEGLVGQTITYQDMHTRAFNFRVDVFVICGVCMLSRTTVYDASCVVARLAPMPNR